MSTLAPAAPSSGHRPLGRLRPRLHGLTWLVWRQYRASFRLGMICALVLTGYLVYLHASFAGYLAAQARVPGVSTGDVAPDAGFSVAALLLYLAPLLAGTTFGAQLFEREYTEGTFALVCTQSVSSTAWLRAKLLVPAAMLLLCVTPCAAALTLDYGLDPNRGQIFLGQEIFEAIGPAAVAVSMVGLLLGAAAGLALRRSGAAQSVALLLVLAFKLGLWMLPDLVNQGAPSPMWTLQWITTAVCAVTCALLVVYCRRLIERRPS